MHNDSSSDDLNNSTTLGWKFVAIVTAITAIFFTFLYLAMSNKPDYMQKHPTKAIVQNEATKNTPHLVISSAPSNDSE